MLGWLIGYLFVQLALAWWVSRRIKTDADYFLAGRQFSYPVVSLSLFATWFGAETCIGSSGAVYQVGLSGARADPIGYGLCLLLFGAVVVRKLWSKKYTTLSDFFRFRYGPKTEIATALILSLTSMIWASAQLRAFGQVFMAIDPLQLQFGWVTALAIGAVMIYGSLGGLRADMLTDSIQSVLIVAGMLACFFVFINRLDLPFYQAVSQITPERWSMIGEEESWAFRINRWAIPIFGSLMAQELVSRVFAAKNSRIAVGSCGLAALLYMTIGSIPVLIGLLGPGLKLEISEPEHFLVILAKELMSPALFIVFVGAILAALLATLDSVLLAVSALLTHNLAPKAFSKLSQRHKLRWSRFALIATGIAVYLISAQSSSILDLLELASSFGSGGILVVGLMGLWTQRGDERAAVLTLCAGVLSVLLFTHVFKSELYFIFSVCVGAVVFIFTSSISELSKKTLNQRSKSDF